MLFQRITMKTTYMKNFTSLLFPLLFLLGLNSYAQVEFNLENSGNNNYELKLISSVDWLPPFNVTATAQISFLVPTGGFELNNLQNINGAWAANSLVIAPTENPDFDYVTVGLTSLGTNDIDYVNGQEITLFTFENSGICTGPIALMEVGDPFTFPNSQNINVGNQLTTLGSGNLNAWTGNYGLGNANCSDENPSVLGCTDELACNYNPLADQDDGSCDIGLVSCPEPCNTITGCTDTNAENFDPLANCDDGSCTYSTSNNEDNGVCGFYLTVEADDCSEVCMGRTTINIANEYLDGSNQWFIEFYSKQFS